eukprot:CAMPEP_0170469606 /NCGR_PEP_ID=MMETSP0123-20130129/12380_1 /TAXON_ID=182087 /ORGANISM="Favella ehrenbergii, Strain Fehren 1" /LENGTH=219 /DNA_ID=CAMNT_0010736531 /DNA_START=66 /DNA_END=725 /DNA_ORIENTATION=+
MKSSKFFALAQYRSKGRRSLSLSLSEEAWGCLASIIRFSMWEKGRSCSEHSACSAVKFEDNDGDVVLATTLQCCAHDHLSNLLSRHIIIAERDRILVGELIPDAIGCDDEILIERLDHILDNMGCGDQTDTGQRMVAKGACHGQHAAESIIEDDATSAFNSRVFLRVVALIINAQSLSLATLGEDGSRVANVGHIEHIIGTLFPHDGDTCGRTAAITVE